MDAVERLIGLIAVILGVAGGPAGFFLGRRQRAAEADKTEAEGGKAEAEALSLVRAVYGAMVSDLVTRMDVLEAENVALRGRLAEMEETQRNAQDALKERDGRIAHLEELVAALQSE